MRRRRRCLVACARSCLCHAQAGVSAFSSSLQRHPEIIVPLLLGSCAVYLHMRAAGSNRGYDIFSDVKPFDDDGHLHF